MPEVSVSCRLIRRIAVLLALWHKGTCVTKYRRETVAGRPWRKAIKYVGWAVVAAATSAGTSARASAETPAALGEVPSLSLVPPPPKKSPAPEAAAPAATDAAAATMPATTPSTVPAEDTAPYIPESMEPLGASGGTDSPFSRRPVTGGPQMNRLDHQDGFLPIPDRWRIGLPGDYVQNTRGNIYDPYHQNVLKGDYPIFGQEQFLIVTLTSDTLFEARKVYVPSGQFSNSADSQNFFGKGSQQFVQQNFIVSLEYFIGETSYKPRDLEVKATMVANYNYVHQPETQILSPEPGDGNDRQDNKLAFQELFVDKHLHDLSNNYDFFAIRAGIQGFNSDFRGFLFNDNEPGVRLLGNYDNNQLIYNVAWFHQLEKDTNSGLNTFNQRDQDVLLANLYREDFIWKGYTAQLSFHFNYDRSGKEHYDDNDFLGRPQPIGTIANKEDRVFYLGWAGDGHIGPVNITHQFYQAFGTESFNPIAGQETTIDARMFAVEASVDNDWRRYRASFFYASGDHNATDDKATGFDSIFDNMNFAGGQFR